MKSRAIFAIELTSLGEMYSFLSKLGFKPAHVDFFDSPGSRYVMLVGDPNDLQGLSEKSAHTNTIFIKEPAEGLQKAIANKFGNPESNDFLVLEFTSLLRALEVVQKVAEDLEVVDFKVYRGQKNQVSVVLGGDEPKISLFNSDLKGESGIIVTKIHDQSGIIRASFY